MMQTPPPLPTPPGLDYVLHQFVPLFEGVVLVLVCIAALRMLLRSPLGEALAERIRDRTRGRQGAPVDGEGPRVAALEEQLARLREQTSELAERLDFAERLLAERRERKLGAGQ